MLPTGQNPLNDTVDRGLDPASAHVATPAVFAGIIATSPVDGAVTLLPVELGLVVRGASGRGPPRRTASDAGPSGRGPRRRQIGRSAERESGSPR